jgi:prepilin peptidase CpaA
MLPQPFSPVAIAVVAVAGLAGAVVDLRTRRVPNALTGSIASAGLVLAAMHAGPVSLLMACAGCLVGLACMLPGHLIGGTGAGDVKLFAAMGTVLGPWPIAVAFLYTALAGGFLAIIFALMRSSLGATVSRTATLVVTSGANVSEIERQTDDVSAGARAKADNRFAYAPAIAIGVLAAALTVR